MPTERKQRTTNLTTTPAAPPRLPGTGNTATPVQSSNVTTDDWSLASYKIRNKTKTEMNRYVRQQQADGAKITIGGQVDEILTAWLKAQGVEV